MKYKANTLCVLIQSTFNGNWVLCSLYASNNIRSPISWTVYARMYVEPSIRWHFHVGTSLLQIFGNNHLIERNKISLAMFAFNSFPMLETLDSFTYYQSLLSCNDDVARLCRVWFTRMSPSCCTIYRLIAMVLSVVCTTWRGLDKTILIYLLIY